jgi:rhomboid protease GluP
LISSFAVYKALPNDIVQYEKEMERFVSMESMALGVYNLPEGTPNEEILFEIKDLVLYYWNDSIKLLDSFNNLDLPLHIKVRNSKLKEYCELRIKSYELIYKAIDEDTDRYNNEINKYIQEIDFIISELLGE